MVFYCIDVVDIHSISHVQLFATPRTVAHHTFLSSGVCSNSCPLSWWCHPTISSSVTHFSCHQSFPASEPSQWIGSCYQVAKYWRFSFSISLSNEFSIPMNTQGCFPLGLTGWTSLQSTGLSRVFSNTTVQKHQFFSAQPSLWLSSYIHTWLLGKP